ncbi:MAG: VOC family protein [Bacteroidetes bacterium]|nr:VOC family protein [Bacteroidota bacterium]
MGRVVHFEIPAADPQKAMDFYSKVFGWKYEGFPGFEYWLATTGSDNEMGINGAIMKRQDPGQPVTNAIAVKDIDESASLIEKLGGQIVVPKSAVPGMGWNAYFKDPDGNIMGLWQVDPDAK